MTEHRYIAALDLGTTSSRCIVFDHAGLPVAVQQREHRQIRPQPGWVEHDPLELKVRADEVISGAIVRAGIAAGDLAAIGITNQRETTVVWDRHSGQPVGNAIAWQDMRTAQFCDELARSGGRDRLRHETGLPLATYFSGPKVRWILEHTTDARARAEAGDLLFGTIDTWAIWNLTGGPRGGLHVTDVTNASRTLLMNLSSLDWDDHLLDLMGVPRSMLPQIRSSSEEFGDAQVAAPGVPIAGDLGDQQAALFGHAAFRAGGAKNTYGTGCFALLNTGTSPVYSDHGLITSVAYQMGVEPAAYCLEGSIAVAGSLVQWLRDNLGIIGSSAEVEGLASTVADNGGVYLVPAFSGLFAPHWRSDARGVMVGLTGYANKGHIARAALEATAWQTREVLDAMCADSGATLEELRVDGGMVQNDMLMQIQADTLGIPVVRPAVTETTALGAAYAAGLAVGFWSSLEELQDHGVEGRRWLPRRDAAWRDAEYATWKRAVERSLNWAN